MRSINNDLNLTDNGFDNQGIVDAPNDQETSQLPSTNQKNLPGTHNLAKGLPKSPSRNKNTPALGVPNKTNQQNPAKGQKKPEHKKQQNGLENKKNHNDDGNRNPLPGGRTNQKDDRKAKKPEQSKANNIKKGPSGIQNGHNRRKGSTTNPKNKRNQRNLKNVIAPNLNDTSNQSILKRAWLGASMKVKVIVITIVPVLLLATIIIMSIFSGTAAALTASMCSTGNTSSSGSSYSGEDYNGSADTKEFLCKMQPPLGKSTFSWSRGVKPGHKGVDLAAPIGTPIYAVQAGTVVETHDGCPTTSSIKGTCGSSMGNHVKIKHGNGNIYTYYMHMKQNSVKVKEEDKVGKGQLIGLVGSSGRSTGAHLHLTLQVGSNYNTDCTSAINDYFTHKTGYTSNVGVNPSFKNACGSAWEGELTGDSANATNDTTDYTSENSSSSNSNETCCDASGSSSGSSETVEGLPKILTQEFIDGAVASQTKYGVPASLTLAQIVQESSGSSPGNMSELAYKCKNLFGIKGKGTNGSCNYKTSEESGGKSFSIHANFRSYNNYSEGIEDHAKLLTSNYYKKCTTGATTSDDWAKAIKKCGYATDVDYAERLISIMKNYNLYQYDTYTSSNTCILGKGSFDGKIWYYDQTDYQQPYGKYGTIATHGCGPTAMAIAVSSLLGQEHNPIELTNYACSNGYCSAGGTLHSFFSAAAKKYGLTSKQVNKKNKDEIFAALKGGKSIVIAIMGPGTFTRDGHFITLTGSDGDKVFVHDPNNGDGKGYNKLWDFSLIEKEVSTNTSTPFWIISK